MRGSGDGEMSTRRKARDANSRWIDAPFGGAAAHQAHGALRVQQWTGSGKAFGLSSAARHAILQYESINARFVQPGRNFLAFEVPREIPVTAARANDNCSAGIFLFWRRKDSDGGSFYICDPFRIFRRRIRRSTNAFRTDFAVGANRRVGNCRAWPDVKDKRLVSAFRWRGNHSER